MPGTIATVNVIAGHKAVRGEVLVTIEAMKMETSVRAERDGVVKEVVARPGQQVDAKDLLVVFEDVAG
jgi:pyruvate carboxylase